MGVVCSLIYLACGALRLARFNVQASSLEKKFFQGATDPDGSLDGCRFYSHLGRGSSEGHQGLSALDIRFIVLLLVCLLALLMVSNIPYRSFKNDEPYTKSSILFSFF